MLGMSDGAERLHYLLELPPDSPAFLHDVESAVGFARNPIYAILHEASWADGGATRWSARARAAGRVRRARTCSPASTCTRGCSRTTGRSRRCATPRSCSPSASGRGCTTTDVLRGNEVPAAAAIYVEDMYVERVVLRGDRAQIRGLRAWITNEYEHNGLRVDGERILGRLLDLARGRA